MCIRVYLSILYYPLFSQNFEHLLHNNMHYYHFYYVSYGPHHIIGLPLKNTSEAKSLEVKESISLYSLLVRYSKYVVNFSKLHI